MDAIEDNEEIADFLKALWALGSRFRCGLLGVD